MTFWNKAPWRPAALPLVALLAAALVGSALTAGIALAQAPPPDQLAREVAGPYEITVSARPPAPTEGLGGPRFSVGVVAYPAGTPITEATVRISLRRPDGTQAGEVALDQNPVTPHLYEARLTLPEVGLWRWTVSVESPRGLELVQGTIQVRPGPSSGSAGIIVWALVLAALAVVGLLAWRALRPRRPARQ